MLSGQVCYLTNTLKEKFKNNHSNVTCFFHIHFAVSKKQAGGVAH